MNTSYDYKVVFESFSESIDVDEKKCEASLNSHGVEGWELVAVCGPLKASKGQGFCYYFKRTSADHTRPLPPDSSSLAL
jgi:Domain of unknown function (DUF4177)